MYAEILIEYPTKKIDKYFTYKIPLALKDIINIGMKVKVPFGTKIINGFVMNILNDFDNEYELKEVTRKYEGDGYCFDLTVCVPFCKVYTLPL